MKYFVYCFFVCLFIFLPRITFAQDIYLPVVDGKTIVTSQIYIGVEDTLHIPTGTKLYFEGRGSIYAKGSVFIGLDSTTPGSEAPDSDTVYIRSNVNSHVFQIDGGNLIAMNIEFEGNLFLEAYRHADVSISNSVVKDVREGTSQSASPIISIYDHSQLELSHSSIISATPDVYTENRPSLIELFNNASSTFVYSKITSQVSDTVFNIFASSNLMIDKTIITSCGTWFMVFGQSTIEGEVNESKCSDSVQQIFTGGISRVKFTYDPCCSSVLFLPGIQATRLYAKDSTRLRDRVWEPSSDAHVPYLTMSPGGVSTRPVFAKDILSELRIAGITVFSIYTNFLQELDRLKGEGVIKEFTQYGYDWRKSPEDIVTPQLISEVKRLASESYSGKVSIVAHSYGGLVTKELLKDLKQAGVHHLIDKVVLVAVPETGAPSALFALLHGYDLQIFRGLFVGSAQMANFVRYMPSIYHLLPAQVYGRSIELIFKKQSYAPALPVSISAIYNWFEQATLTILGEEKSGSIQSGIKIKSSKDLVSKPYILQSEDGVLASIYRQKSASWQSEFISLNSTYKIWSIAGVGIPTLSGMKYDLDTCLILCTKQVLQTIPRYHIDGDGTVILDAITNRLGYKVLFDLKELNRVQKTNIKHANILESKDLVHLINQILISGVVAVNTPYVTDIERQKDQRSKVYQLILDKNMFGSFTSLRKSTGTFIDKGTVNIVDEIPGSRVDVFGDQSIISSTEAPDEVTVVSDKHIRSDILYTVSDNPSLYSADQSVMPEIVQTLKFKQVILPAGTIGSINMQQHTITVGATVYQGQITENVNNTSSGTTTAYTPENSNTGNSTTTENQTSLTSTEKFNLCIQYIDPVLQYTKNTHATDIMHVDSLTHRDIFNRIQNKSLKNKYKKEFERILSILQSVERNVLQGNCMTSQQIRDIQKLFDLSLSAEQRLAELDSGYTLVLNPLRAISVFPLNLLQTYKIQTVRTQSTQYHNEVKELFIFFATLNARLLEFSERYGSIST